MRRKSKKQPIGQRLLSVFLVLGLLFYVGYQVYRSIFSEVTTEMAVMHSVYESIETKGLVFRNETPLKQVDGGYPYYTIENGTRVSKSSVIASIYDDADSGRIEAQMQEIDRQIASLKEIQSEGSSGRITLDMINDQIDNTVYDLIFSTETGFLDGVDSFRFTMLSLLSKKQLITGKEVDFTAKIAQLEQERANLKKKMHTATSVLRAPVAGYFADHSDGYEASLTTDLLPDLTVRQLKEYLDSFSKQSLDYGKIVSGYEWYMACVVPDSYYNLLGVGNKLTLRMTFVLDEPIPVTVYAANKDGQGNLAVVFRCDYMSEELATIRGETVEIQMVEHTGLKVPKRAIIVDENRQPGVYVRSGNVVSFRKIEQEYSEAADYVVCKVVAEDGYLQLYDDVIVGGRGLYDGKIIS